MKLKLKLQGPLGRELTVRRSQADYAVDNCRGFSAKKIKLKATFESAQDVLDMQKALSVLTECFAHAQTPHRFPRNHKPGFKLLAEVK